VKIEGGTEIDARGEGKSDCARNIRGSSFKSKDEKWWGEHCLSALKAQNSRKIRPRTDRRTVGRVNREPGDVEK